MSPDGIEEFLRELDGLLAGRGRRARRILLEIQDHFTDAKERLVAPAPPKNALRRLITGDQCGIFSCGGQSRIVRRCLTH